MADWHDNEIGSLMDECAVVPARVRHHASCVPIGGTPGAHMVHVPDGAVCCVRDGGAGHASGSCEHALPAHAYNWDNSVNPVHTRYSIRLHDVWSPPPQIDREKNALEQEVIGPLSTRACICCGELHTPVVTPRRPGGQPYCRGCRALINARWRAGQKRRRLGWSVLPRRGPPIEFPSTPDSQVVISYETHQRASPACCEASDISRNAPSSAADGRRTGANAKTLCAAAT